MPLTLHLLSWTHWTAQLQGEAWLGQKRTLKKKNTMKMAYNNDCFLYQSGTNGLCKLDRTDRVAVSTG